MTEAIGPRPRRRRPAGSPSTDGLTSASRSCTADGVVRIVSNRCMVSPALATAAVVANVKRPPAALRYAWFLFPLALIAAGGIDGRCRMRQGPMGAVKRWLSPYEGATFIVFPIWLCAVVLLAASVVRVGK